MTSSGSPTRRRKTRAEPGRLAARLGESLLLVGLLAGCAVALGLNSASSGFLLLVGVLIIASRQPLVVSTVAALVATVAYNFFFFPPKHTLVIDDPENWIALATFLLTSLLANRLLVRERRQAENARASREEIEALYELSVALLRGEGGTEQIGRAATQYLTRIGATSGGVILFGASPQQQQVLSWCGATMTDEVEEIAAGVGRHRRTTDIPSRFGRDVCVPLTLGGRVRAALIARGAVRAGTALDSAANLLAFAIERERFMRERAQVEALAQANELKSSLLQAVSHDLKSPLTVLAVESEALERGGSVAEGALSHLRTIRDEVGRLHRRIDNLLSLARFEAGIVSPRIEPTPPADLFRAAREAIPTITASRSIRTSVADDTRDLMVDPSLALEIVINLIENADDAAPEATTIELCAMPSAEVEGRVWVEIRDRGPGLTAEQARRMRTIEPPRVEGGGLGIELARTLAALIGGSVEWFEREGGGTVARVDVPAAPLAVAEAS
jgi:two-component system sensor histidine kinase KdpD